MIYYIAPIQYKRADGRKYANKFAYLVSPITRYSLEPKTLIQKKSLVADTIGTIGSYSCYNFLLKCGPKKIGAFYVVTDTTSETLGGMVTDIILNI